MTAVVNHLHFTDPVDPELFAAAERDLVPQMREIEGFEALHVIQTGPTDVILIILGTSPAVADQVATEVGSPWMGANVVPLLAGPPDRHVGETIATSDR